MSADREDRFWRRLYGGIWFDDGEIAELLGMPHSGRAAIPANARVSQQPCPRCNEPLHVFAYPGTMTVVDGCRRCGGIRLDAGEFEEIRGSQQASRIECRPSRRSGVAESASM